MRLLLVITCLLGSSLGASLERKPRHCKSPPLLTGAFTFATQNEKAWFYALFAYDAWQERIRVYETGTYNNQSFTYDALLLFREGAVYNIDDKSKKCTKQPLKADFQPMGVPANASLLGQAVIGSSSGPGEGLLVNTWVGQSPEGAQYMVTVTEFGCLPVSTVYKTEEFGWVIVSYINNIKGITDPNVLNPPAFCPDLDAKPEGKPMGFMDVLVNMKNHAL